MQKSFFDEKLIEKVNAAGWQQIDAGATRRKDLNELCIVFMKAQPLADRIDLSAKEFAEKPEISTIFGSPKDSVMEIFESEGGVCYDFLSTLSSGSSLCDDYLSITSSFVDSLRLCSNHKLCIKADVCWTGNSELICYNLSFIFNNFYFNFIYFPFTDIINKLSIDLMLGVIFDFLKVNRLDRRVNKYKYIPSLNDAGNPIVCVSSSFNEAKSNAKYVFNKSDNKPLSISLNSIEKDCLKDFKSVIYFIDSDVEPLNVTLLLDHGLRFFSFVDSSKPYIDLLRSSDSLFEHKHGLCSSRPILRIFNSLYNNGFNYIYYVKFNIRDVCLHSILGDNYTTEDLGRISSCKIFDYSNSKFKNDFIKVLDKYLEAFPDRFLDFCSTQNFYHLFYMSRIWGFNRSIGTTIGSSACKLAMNEISKFLGCDSKGDYLAVYSGLSYKSGVLKRSESDKFYRKSRYSALSDDCDIIQKYSSLSYRGGFNGCFNVVKHNGYNTYDVDIASAYPTAMYLVPGIDWANPIQQTYRDVYLTLDDFKDYDGNIDLMTPIFVNCTYEFPKDCLFPNLPHYKEDDNDAPCYPLYENSGVYCCGTELYTALKMGAKIKVINGFKCNVFRDHDGDVVYPYRNLIYNLVKARGHSESLYGNKCLESKLLKFIVNNLYGKVAAHVSDMFVTVFNYSDKRESEITNNASAALLTSLVRSVLFSAFNDIYNNGYTIYSATTDGLITDMPFDLFKEQPLFGFRKLLESARSIISDDGDSSVWVIKHAQDDLLNLCTRGNASLIEESSFNLGGVLAKNGLSSAFPELPKECLKNREAFVKACVSREGKLSTVRKKYTHLSEVKNGIIYTVSENYPDISMDFDMKRKPLLNTLKSVDVTIDGEIFEFATIETVPFKDKDEYHLYRKIKNDVECLRTVDDWKYFFKLIDAHENGNSRIIPKSSDDLNFKILKDCISGFKAGKWDIPALSNKSLKVADKVEWIQSFNSSAKHTFTKKIWEKCSERKNQDNLLAFEILKPTLIKLGAVIPE